MDEYNQLGENTISSRGNFLYGGSLRAPSSSLYGRTNNGSNNQQSQFPIKKFHNQSIDWYEQSEGQGHTAVKTEAGTTQNHAPKFHYPCIIRGHHSVQDNRPREQDYENSSEVDAIKDKIIAHPQYSNLLEAYMDCQKVGAPPEVVAQLTAVLLEFETRQRASAGSRYDPKDPALDQFMEDYYDILVKYRGELTRPLQEAMEFMRMIETQLNMLTGDPDRIFNSEKKCEGVGSSEEDQENSGGETELPEIDPRAEDRELKNHLLRKYSGYLSGLKKELFKKKKKGKLPKDARQKLLSWWEIHNKWPYPSESEKVALAESTGLDQKQINNWFVNQRKRHWKPSEDMQLTVMDGLHPHNEALYMEGHYMAEGPYRLGP